ncbi:MAG TPA: sigma 54-interacting transcriptional regulator [Polyangiaceae bacterium]|nr:sigma 54-interacting transcriptional regulator [Polyangiaceae bacterium]
MSSDSTADNPLELIVYLKGASLTYPLPRRGTVRIGRGTQSDVRIDDSSVSRNHVLLHFDGDGGIELEELGSSNGTQLFPSGNQQEEREDTQQIKLNWFVKAGNRIQVRIGDVMRIGSVPCVVQAATGEAPKPAPPVERASRPPSHNESRILVDSEMKRVYDLAVRAAKSDIGVLILGETGVGKELLAETIHVNSRRVGGQFLRLNCVALSDSLLESELFGHEKGAFTGATHSRAGLLESTSGGTVFLDEIGEMPLKTQAKLLRVLEERRIMRVGSTRSRTVDVRFVAATNRNLQREIARGTFRGDLFYRISGIQLRVPPLRERKDELEPLARHFLETFCRRSGVPVPELSSAAIDAMKAYAWPGNVRELKNAMERAPFLSAGGPILPEHLPQTLGEEDLFSENEVTDVLTNPAELLANYSRRSVPDDIPSVTKHVPPAANLPVLDDQAERDRITEALDQCGGNQTRAAKLLGISRRTLINRLDSFGMPRPRKRTGERTGDPW